MYALANIHTKRISFSVYIERDKDMKRFSDTNVHTNKRNDVVERGDVTVREGKSNGRSQCLLFFVQIAQ